MISISVVLVFVLSFDSINYTGNYNTKILSAGKTIVPANKSAVFEKLANTNQLPAAGNWTDDFKNVNANGIFGLASQFNVFANNLYQSQSVVGNAAVKNLASTGGDGAGEFGTRGISYIQSSLAFNGVIHSQAGTLILGNAVNYQANFQYGKPGIDRNRLEDFSGNVRQDQKKQQYINFQDQFDQLESHSKTLAAYSKNNVPAISVSSYSPRKTFDLSAIDAINGTKYITIKAADISSTQLFILKGISDATNIVITVDTSGQNNVIFTNSQFFNEVEGRVLVGKNLMFNFFNNANQSDYTGQVTFNNVMTSLNYAVLATAATVNLQSKPFHGNVAANTVNQQYSTYSDEQMSDITMPTPAAPSAPVISDVPDVNFGQINLGGPQSAQGLWSEDLAVTGQQNQKIAINVALTQNFTNQQVDYAADSVRWSLLNLGSQAVTPFSETGVPMTSLSYTIQKSGTSEYPLKNYALVVSNLGSVKYAGNYSATLTWTFTDSP